MQNVILEALDKMAVALADHNHQWSDELRSSYEQAVEAAQQSVHPTRGSVAQKVASKSKGFAKPARG